MRIISADIDAFGGARDCLLPDLDAPVVCVAGPNEIGKSTFYSFLVSMLFGFPTKKADKKLISPSDGRAVSGRLKYRLGDGSAHILTRSTADKVEGILRSGDGLFDREIKLDNAPIPAVTGISRLVFEQVHALTMDDMRSLDSKTFGEIREALLGLLNFAHIRPVHEVLLGIEKEAASLWRSDNRGKPDAGRIAASIEDCRYRLSEARAAEIEMISLQETLPQYVAQLDEKIEESIRLRSRLDDMVRLQGLKTDSVRLESLTTRSQIVTGFGDLADVVGQELSVLHKQRLTHEEAYRSASAKLADLNANIASFDERARLVVSNASQIRGLAQDSEDYRRSEESLSDNRTQLSTIATNRAALCADVLDVNADPDVVLGQDSIDELAAMIDSHQTASRLLDVGMEKAAAVSVLRKDSSRMLGAGGIAVLVGASCEFLILLASLEAYNMLLLYGGGITAVVGLILLVAGLLRRSRYEQYVFDLDLGGSRIAHRDALAALHSHASQLQLRTGIEPSNRTVEQLGRIRTLDDRRADLSIRAADSLHRIRTYEKRVELLGLWETIPETNFDTVVADLVSELRVSEKAAMRANEAVNDRAAVKAVVEQTARALSDATEQIEKLERRLAQLGDGQVDRGLIRLEEGRSALLSAALLRDSIESRYSAEDKRQLRDLESEGDDLEQLIRSADARASELQRSIAEHTSQLERRRARFEHLQTLPQASAVNLEMQDLREEQQRIKDRRDRLILLRNIMTVAEKRFRENHEPDVLKRAGKYLSVITDGEWVRLRQPQNGVLEVVDARGRTASVKAPMSRGTLDQIFLSLRLGIVDHIDRAMEKLPVFLDEILVNWDRDRRSRIYPIIAEMAKQRQIFFFTCHDWMREELVVHLDAHVIDLDQLPDPTSRQHGQMVRSRSHV